MSTVPHRPKKISNTARPNRRALLIAAVAASAVLALTSCGPSGSNAEHGTIRIATLDGEPGNGVKAQLKALEAATGIKAELSVFPQDQLRQKVSADLLGSKEFDVVIEPFTWLHELATNEQILPLDDYIAGDNDIDVDDFIPVLLDSYGNFDGKQYTLPYKPDAQLFYYRKDVFADPAVQMAFQAKTGRALTVPTTNDELVETAQFFTQSLNPDSPTKYGWSFWGEQVGSFWTWAMRLGGLGGNYVDDDGHPTVDTKEGREAMAIAEQLRQAAPEEVGSFEWERSNQSFLSGEVAMIEQWPGLATLAEATDGTSQVAGKVGYTVPVGGSSILGGWAAAVSAGSDNPDAAFKAVAWMTGKEGELLKVDAGNAPTRNSVYASLPAEGKTAYFPVLAKALAVAKINADVDFPPIGGQLQTSLQTDMNAVWTNQLDGDEALTKINEAWTKALQEAGLYK
ncbi:MULTISPECIES: ABC transporter substrate-binding protein [Plantibacter]|uniref:ABC transporter substrate-binding protein n=1 Tax=Plantibacter TaxID=190323 RepID=UPI001375F21B|nr:sugar ABC transporter substrate-binding protein [Plantibacter flavus]MBD8103903.1 sugar ABC transporter substrate-binding protein [Plantibacter sp. CFBP 8775]MBD8467351.1 sugar ABC transporter substrate-binding protein [Plantibacter sp. CFBP 8798]